MVGVELNPFFENVLNLFVCIKLFFTFFISYLFQCIEDHKSNFKKRVQSRVGSIPWEPKIISIHSLTWSFISKYVAKFKNKNKIKKGSIILKCDLKINRFLLFMYIFLFLIFIYVPHSFIFPQGRLSFTSLGFFNLIL